MATPAFGLLDREGDIGVNIRIIGDEGVGKSTLVAYFEGEVSKPYDGGVKPDISKVYTVPDPEKIGTTCDVKAHIWDTPRWIRWDDSEVTLYASELDGVILVIDLTNEHTWINVKTKWLPWIERMRNESGPDRLGNIPLLLLGNKCDSPSRIVQDAKIQKFLKSPKNKFVDYAEISAKTGQGIEEVFPKYLRTVAERKLKNMAAKNSSLLESSLGGSVCPCLIQ